VAALAEGFVAAGLWEMICFEFEAGALDFIKRSEEDKCIVVNSLVKGCVLWSQWFPYHNG